MSDEREAGAVGGSLRGRIDPFIVMDVISRAARLEAGGTDVVHMEVGQPSTAAPLTARAAVAKALDREPLGYTETLGMYALRQRIAQHYHDTYGANVSAEQIVVTSGSSAGFVLAFLALFDFGARVAIASPGYPCYRQIMRVLGIEPVVVDTGEAGRWMPTVGQVEQVIGARGVQGVLLASPANPTGVMFEPGKLARLVAVCDRENGWFISDEIYHGLTYSHPAETAFGKGRRVVVINSFSKYFSMTGWRVGWMVLPTELVRTVERIAQNLFISAPAVAQVAALGAFDGMDELERNRCRYLNNRDLLQDGLKRAGLAKVVPADGAFYLYVDVSRYTDDSVSFAQTMLEEIGVAATPGVDFDPVRGHRFMRFSYSGSEDTVREGVRRLVSWRQLGGK